MLEISLATSYVIQSVCIEIALNPQLPLLTELQLLVLLIPNTY